VNARNLLKMSRSSASQNDWAKAKDYADEALKMEPGYLDALYMRAYAYRELDNYPLAEADFKEVIRQDPRYLPTYGALAEIYVDQKEYEKADKVFLDLGKQPGGETWANYYRGVIAYLKADLAGAEKFWQDAVKLEASFAPGHHNLGALYLAQGNSAKALVKFREALQKEPEKALYQFHTAWALERLGQVAAAQKILKEIMDGSTDDQKSKLLAMGMDRLTRNNAEAAVKVLSTVSEQNPDNLDVWILLGRANLALKKPEEARAALEKAKELDASFLEVDTLLGQLPAKAKAEVSPKVEESPKAEESPKVEESPEAHESPKAEEPPAGLEEDSQTPIEP